MFPKDHFYNEHCTGASRKSWAVSLGKALDMVPLREFETCLRMLDSGLARSSRDSIC